MREEQLRRRLEMLNRGPLPEGAGVATPPAPSVQQAALPRTSAESASARSPAIAGLLRRGEVVATGVGEHLRIRLPLDAFWTGGSRLVAARQEHLRSLLAGGQPATGPSVARDEQFAALVAALPDRVLMLDLETCGLAGSALFLIGLLRQIKGQPTVELLLARDYAEEAAVLESLWQIVPGHDVLVTFNGKSFDWPMVVDRSVRHRLDVRGRGEKLLHLDMLHHARRRWSKQLPNCRLQTLEQLVCRRHRTGDIPGHQIPAAYAEFVRTGFPRELDSILYHNAMDLVTLLDLALRLAG